MVLERGSDAPGRAVEPDSAEALVDRGGEQQPHALDAARVTANRSGVDIGTRGEHVYRDEQVVRAHSREVSPDELRAFVCEPVSQEGRPSLPAGESRGSISITICPDRARASAIAVVDWLR